MELVLPDVRYKDSFIKGRSEVDSSPWRREWASDSSDALMRTDFEVFVAKIHAQSRGEELPEGYVPMTQYWLVDGDTYIGRLSIRHELNDHLRTVGGHIGYDIRPSMRGRGYGKEMLRLGLEKARVLGLTKVLLTCDETNEASKKVIEANGGVLEKYHEMGEGAPRKMLFWIAL